MAMDAFFGGDTRHLEVGTGYFGCGDPPGPGPRGHCLPATASAEWRLNRSGFEDNTKILKEIYDRSVNLCSSFCGDASFNENDETERCLDHGSDSEFCVRDVSPEISPSFRRELLNKSVGSMENVLSKNARDHVRDLNACGDQPDSPKVCRGVRLNPKASVCQYDALSSEDEERIERYKENRAAVMHNDTHRSAMARIEDMWDMFAVDDYAPWSEFREDLKQKRSHSLSRIDAGASKYPITPSVWKKKTTIPKPPSMLLREANRTPRKTKAMIELDQKIEEKKQLEDLECKRQFRATPAPDHVRLRLFEELNQQQEERRKFLRENGEEILKSLQQPFEFSKREEMKRQEKMREFSKHDQKKSNGHFHARPFPSHIFNGTVEDRIMEEEEYRQIRMRMRAEELLNSSVAPYSMRMQNWRKVEPKRRKPSDDEDVVCTFHPKVNQTIPDLDDQYQRFVEQMIQCKGRKQPTTCQPFNLRLSKPQRAHNTARHSTSAKVSRYEGETTGDSHVTSFDMSSSQRLLDKGPSKLDLGERQRPTGGKKQKPKKAAAEVAADMGVVDGFGNTAIKNNRMKSEAGIALPMYRKVDKFGTEIESKDENLLNRTYDLDDRDPCSSSLTSDNAGSNIWCHPSIVKRTQFWSNPVAIIKYSLPPPSVLLFPMLNVPNTRTEIGKRAFSAACRRRVIRPTSHYSPPSRHILAYITGGLKALYRQIQKSAPAIDFGQYTDGDGNFNPAVEMPLLASRYQFVEVIGAGQSSIILRAKDSFQDGREVAIKVLKVSYGCLGPQEAGCLVNLNNADPQRFAPILRLLNTFQFGQHYSMVFELLQGSSLAKVFAEKQSTEEKLHCIRKVALRLLSAVGFLQSRRIIHADLKPENLLLGRGNKLSSLKVVDFGNAFHCIHDEMSLYYDGFELQTLIYRAPEVLFGMMFGMEIDMWSIGCILAELYAGVPIFYGPDLESILVKMNRLLGPLPLESFERGKFYPNLEKFTKCNVKPLDLVNIMDFLGCSDFLFIDFLLRLLRYDPASRMTVTDAAEHPFLAPELSIKYFNLRKVYNTLPLYPKTFLTDETYQYSLKEIKPRISTSALDQDLSSFKTKLPKVPDILLIALNKKIVTDDRKCQSLSSETKKESRKPGVDDSDGSSEKNEAIKEVTSFSTRFTSAFMKDGHAADEERRSVERSSDAIFSRSRWRKPAECNFHSPKVRLSILTHLESNPFIGPTVKPSPGKVDVVAREAERRELTEDPGRTAEVSESDCKDHVTTPQKKNLRELKLVLSKVTGSSPSVLSASGEGDKSQPYDICSKTNLNAVFNKQSPKFNLIAKELPEINKSINNSNLSSKNTKNGNNSFTDAGSQASGAEINVKPQSQRKDKALPRIGGSFDYLKLGRKSKSAYLLEQHAKTSTHSDQTSLSQRIPAVSRKPEISTSKNYMKLANSVGKIEYKSHLTPRESSRSSGTMSVCSGLPNPTKSNPYSEREKTEQKDNFKKPQRVSGDEKQGKRMIQQFVIDGREGGGERVPRKKQSRGNLRLETTFVVEEPLNTEPKLSTRSLLPSVNISQLVLPHPSTDSSDFQDAALSKSDQTGGKYSVRENQNKDHRMNCVSVIGEKFGRSQRVKKHSVSNERKKSGKRQRNCSSMASTRSGFPSTKRRKISFCLDSSGLQNGMVKYVSASPSEADFSTSAFDKNRTKQRSHVRQASLSVGKPRDLNETFMLNRNDRCDNPDRRIPSDNLEVSPGNKVLGFPRKHFFVERAGKVASEADERRNPDYSASDVESISSDDSAKSGYTDGTISNTKYHCLNLSTSDITPHDSDDSAKSGYTLETHSKTKIDQKTCAELKWRFTDSEDSDSDELIMLTP